MRILLPLVLLLTAACGVPNDKSLTDLDAKERESICADVPKETAVCQGVEVTRGAPDCEVTLASVGARCDVTVGEFQDALDSPICAYLEDFDWGRCFDTWVSNEPNNASNEPNNVSNEPNNVSNEPNNASNEPNNESNQPNNAAEFDPQFLEVAGIIRQNCALGGCHGNPPGAAQVHLHPSGQNSTPAEIEATLSQTTPTNSGNRLIQPGDPNMSEIYVRITKPAGDVQLMGAGTYGAAATPLPQSQIDTIAQWISDGANYRR